MVHNKNGLYIFEWLTQKEIAYFIMMSETRLYHKWVTILSEWDVSDNRAYLIEAGSVDIFRSGRKVDSLHSGDIFWEMALMADEARSASVIANTETEVLVFNKDEFLMLCRKSWLYEEIRWKILGRVKDNFYGNK
jgi:cGMP-dependent protein kinase